MNEFKWMKEINMSAKKELAYEMLEMIDQNEAYDGKSALNMLDLIYGRLLSITGRESLAQMRPELVGKIVGGGNRKEDLE